MLRLLAQVFLKKLSANLEKKCTAAAGQFPPLKKNGTYLQCQPMQTDIFQMVIMLPKLYSTIKSS